MRSGMYDHEMKGFLRHEECPKCGSLDNVAVYYNEDLGGETKTCFSEGCGYRITDADLRKGMKKKLLDHEPLPQYYDWRKLRKNYRGVTYENLGKYHSGYLKSERAFYYPYEVNLSLDTHVGAKVVYPPDKGADKRVVCRGSVSKAMLFGKHTVSERRRTIIVTEGELDAISAYQMTGFNAVSLPTGAASAEGCIKENLKFLEQFEKIWVCFDRDRAGMEAADKVMDILKPGAAHLVLLEEGMDVNDYLQQGREDEFKEALNDAKPRIPSNIIGGSDLWEAFLEYQKKSSDGISTGLRGMDDHFKLRPGEVTTLIGQPSVGKSSLARQIVANLIKQGKQVMVFSYEESYLEYYKRILCMVYDINPLAMTEEDMIFLESHHHVIDSHLLFCKAPTSEYDEVLKLVEYGSRSRGIDLVVYDNLTGALGGSGDFKTEVGGFYNQLTNMTKEYRFHTIVVSHVRRDKDLDEGQPPSISHAYGSGHIERLSDNVLAMGNSGNIATLAMRKQRHSGRVFDINLSFNPKTFTYNGNITMNTKDEQDGVQTEKKSQSETSGSIRLDAREGSASVHSESVTDTEPVPASDVRSNPKKKVQSRLPDSVRKRNTLYRGQRTTRQKDYRAIARAKARGKESTCVVGFRQNEKILKAVQKQYRGVGEPESD